MKTKLWRTFENGKVFAGDALVAVFSDVSIADYVVRLHNNDLTDREKHKYFETHCVVCGSTENLYRFPSGPKCGSPDCIGF